MSLITVITKKKQKYEYNILPGPYFKRDQITSLPTLEHQQVLHVLSCYVSVFVKHEKQVFSSGKGSMKIFDISIFLYFVLIFKASNQNETSRTFFDVLD